MSANARVHLVPKWTCALACRDGLTITLGFTQDIRVPPQYMQTPGSSFDENAQQWVWQFDGEDMPLEIGSTLRFKAREICFTTEQSRLTTGKRAISVATGALTHY
jgi:DNA-directed RNA polymerase subunit E'/Rpb7